MRLIDALLCGKLSRIDNLENNTWLVYNSDSNVFEVYGYDGRKSHIIYCGEDEETAVDYLIRDEKEVERE